MTYSYFDVLKNYQCSHLSQCSNQASFQSAGEFTTIQQLHHCVLPSYAQIPGSASPAPAGCWLQVDPETRSRVEAEGAERWWSLERKQTSEPLHSLLSTVTDSEENQVGGKKKRHLADNPIHTDPLHCPLGALL